MAKYAVLRNSWSSTTAHNKCRAHIQYPINIYEIQYQFDDTNIVHIRCVRCVPSIAMLPMCIQDMNIEHILLFGFVLCPYYCMRCLLRQRHHHRSISIAYFFNDKEISNATYHAYAYVSKLKTTKDRCECNK